MKLSQSGLKRFDECPGKAWLRYGEGLEEETNYFAEVGKLVHELVEDKINGVVDKLYKPSDATVEAFELFHRWERIFLPDLNPQDVLSVEEKTFIQFGKNELEFRFDDVRDIGGFLYITDWKTTNKLLTTEEMKKDIQTKVYSVVAMKIWPTYSEMVYRIGNIRHGVYQTLELERAEVESWEDSLKDQVTLVASHIEARKRGESTACPFTPGDPCINCGFFNRCPEAKKLMLIPKKDLIKPLLREDTAVSVGEKLIVLGRYYEDLKKALKAWVEAKGPVKLNGTTWAIRPTLSNWIDIERVPEEMMEELKPYLKLDDGKKSSIWENKDLIGKLQGLGAVKIKISNRFEAKEDNEPEDGTPQSN